MTKTAKAVRAIKRKFGNVEFIEVAEKKDVVVAMIRNRRESFRYSVIEFDSQRERIGNRYHYVDKESCLKDMIRRW